MACKLKEAIALVKSKPAANKRLEALITNGELMEKEFGTLSSTIAGNVGTGIKEFGKSLGRLIRDITNVKVKRDKQYTLRQIRAGMSGIELGNIPSYGSDITINGYVTDAEVTHTVTKDFYEKVLDGTLDNLESIKTEEDLTTRLDEEVAIALDTIKGARGTNFLLHELLHAGANEYIATNPNEPATLRIETIFNYLNKNHKELGITEGYWQTNIEEFIAEALSNKELINELLGVKLSKPVSRLANMYEVLLNNLLQMLGFKGKELTNLFDVLLDANLKILEETTPINKEARSTAKAKTTPVKKEQVSDVIKNKEDILADIIPDISMEEQRLANEMLREQEYEYTVDTTKVAEAEVKVQEKKLEEITSTTDELMDKFLKDYPIFAADFKNCKV